jgi:hypothetical protein
MKRVARTGELADRFSAEFGKKRVSQPRVAADRQAENMHGLADTIRGAGGRDRTGDVQLGKGADAGEPGKPEDENP